MFGLSRYNYEEFRRSRLMRDIAKARFNAAPTPGEQAPDFELKTLDGEIIRLHDVWRNNNVVLTFGSATCPLTAASAKSLQALYKEFAGKGLSSYSCTRVKPIPASACTLTAASARKPRQPNCCAGKKRSLTRS